MIRYEWKKMFSKKVNRVLLLILSGLTLAFSYFAVTSSFYVDEHGVEHSGINAVPNLTKVRREWRGVLTSEMIEKALVQRQKLDRTYGEEIPNEVYGKEIQGYDDVIHFVNAVLRADGEYDSRAMLRLHPEKFGVIYQMREENLRKMVSNTGKNERQQAFLEKIYSKVKTPFYYEPYETWEILFRYTNILGLIMALFLTIPVAGVFVDEFQTRAEAVFFSTKYGRKKAIWSKIGAVFLLVSAVYWGIMLLFTLICVGVMGASGHSVSYSINFTYTLYPWTFFQIHLLILVCEYVATLFAASVAMLVAAKTKKSPLAIFVPFVLFAVSPFVAREMPFKGFFQLTPDQLLNVHNCLRISHFYQVGNTVFRQIPFIGLFYAIMALVLTPVTHKLYSAYK